MSVRRVRAGAGLAVLATAVLTGCSQVAALAPVGGNRVTIVRFAGNDVLVAAGIDLLTAPLCTTSGDAVDCRGTTVDGAAVVVTSTAQDQADMTVTVGDRTVYRGSVQAVLDAAARPSP